ncbi:MAG: J domain-containing protein [Chloroflexi bacterium]|nr:J domain-containing protein [Chloroflexota bacterium]
MRGQPDPTEDPYRTLGLEPGASAAEVKRAYRLLAKAFHPDSAGEAAVPRFLAIHAAYEQLKTGKPVAGPRTSRPAPPPAAEPWRADPSRARAARERARSARSGPTTGARPTGATGSAGPTGRTGRANPTGTGAASGSGGGSAGSSSSGTRKSGRRRDTRKATMGSTSYDEARDPSDATWSGASWYGPSSGEYWIVNPREYADPRKHGPEYLQRARRPLAGDAPDESHARPGTAPESFATGGAASGSESARYAGTARPAGGAWRAGPVPAPGVGIHRSVPAESAAEPDQAEALGAASRAWLGGPADDPIRRLGLALVAWPPIGIAAAAAIGEVTGCASFSAVCSGPEPLLPWLAQAAILGLLLLLPPIARLLAGGAIGVLIALVPITVFLLSIGGGSAPQAGVVLAVLLGVAWLVGIGWAARTLRWRPGAGPTS